MGPESPRLALFHKIFAVENSLRNSLEHGTLNKNRSEKSPSLSPHFWSNRLYALLGNCERTRTTNL